MSCYYIYNKAELTGVNKKLEAYLDNQLTALESANARIKELEEEITALYKKLSGEDI